MTMSFYFSTSSSYQRHGFLPCNLPRRLRDIDSSCGLWEARQGLNAFPSARFMFELPCSLPIVRKALPHQRGEGGRGAQVI